MFACALSAQQMVFSMTAFGVNVGKMTVNRTFDADSTEIINMHSQGHVKLLWIDRADETIHEVRYRKGKLISSNYKHIQNGEVVRWCTITFDGKQYQVNSDKGKSTFTEAPTYSIASLYYHFPKNITRIFYEVENEYSPLKYTDPNTVDFKTSDGNRNIYKYVNGTLNEMEFRLSLTTVYMKRI